jgi:hypothetical protein
MRWMSDGFGRGTAAFNSNRSAIQDVRRIVGNQQAGCRGRCPWVCFPALLRLSRVEELRTAGQTATPDKLLISGRKWSSRLSGKALPPVGNNCPEVNREIGPKYPPLEIDSPEALDTVLEVRRD